MAKMLFAFKFFDLLWEANLFFYFGFWPYHQHVLNIHLKISLLNYFVGNAEFVFREITSSKTHHF